MLKSFISRSLRRVFDDVFVDLDHDGGTGFRFDLNFLSGGRSNLTLTDQELRPDLFDVLLQPLRLVHGSIGLISIDGLAELSSSVNWNVPIKIEFSNVSLLFRVDTDADAERVQFLKKVLVELQSGGQGPCSPLSQLIIGEMLAKLLRTKAPLKDPDQKKRRALLLRGLTLLFRHTDVVIKGVHIRLETEAGAGGSVGAVGVSLASLRMRPGTESQRPPLCSTDALLLSCQLKSLQVYVDYERGGYSTKQAFARKELHIGLAMPLDVHAMVTAELLRRGAFVVPTLTITTPNLIVASDPRQAEVLAQLHEAFCRARRRFASLHRVSSLWGQGNVPRLTPCTGLHLLPSIAYQSRTFPTQLSVPAASASGSLVSFFKRRLQGKAVPPSSSSSSSSRPWARAMWKHTIRFVISEVRRRVPLGRWKEVARYAYFRRQYAFLYSRLLRRGSPEGGYNKTEPGGGSSDAPLPHAPPFFEDIDVAMPGSVLSRLNLMEVALPLSSILQFRLVAVLIAHVEERHAFLARSRKADTSTAAPVVVWRDILKMQLALLQVSTSKSLWSSILGRAEEEEDDEEEGKNDVSLSQLLGHLVEAEAGGAAASSSSSSSSPGSSSKSQIFTNLDLKLHPELGAHKASAPKFAKIIEAAQWVHERHVSPVKLLLPCISVVLSNVEAQFRTQVSDGKRATLGTLSLLRCSLSALVSQSEGEGAGGAGALLCLRAEAQQVLISAAAGGSALQPLALSLPSSGPNALSLCLVIDISDAGVAGDLSVHLPDLRCPLDPAALAFLSSEPVRGALRRFTAAGRQVFELGSAISAPLPDSSSQSPPLPPPMRQQKGEFARYARWLARMGPLIRLLTITWSVHFGRAEVEMPALLVSAVAKERARELAARAREACGLDQDLQDQDQDRGVDEADSEDLAVLRGISQHIRSTGASSPLRAILRVALDSRLWGASGPADLEPPTARGSQMQMRVSVPAVDLLVSKRPLPGEGRKVELEFKLAGLELTLPVSENALAHCAAGILHALV